jgi:hypothetical protein
MLQTLIDRMDKYHSSPTATPPISDLSPSHAERTAPMQTSTPYNRHPHAPPLDTFRQHSHPDPLRRDDDWRQPDSSSRWVPSRAELTKFDGTNLVDWLNDCEYYFCTSQIPEFYKVQTVIPSLVGEAREWHRYFKLSNPDPSW